MQLPGRPSPYVTLLICERCELQYVLCIRQCCREGGQRDYKDVKAIRTLGIVAQWLPAVSGCRGLKHFSSLNPIYRKRDAHARKAYYELSPNIII